MATNTQVTDADVLSILDYLTEDPLDREPLSDQIARNGLEASDISCRMNDVTWREVEEVLDRLFHSGVLHRVHVRQSNYYRRIGS